MTNLRTVTLVAGVPTNSGTVSTLDALLDVLSLEATQQQILAKLSADPATQTTLAAVLAKLSSDPALGAKQDTGNTSLASILAKLSADPATQTTLAAVLAKLSADPATQTTLAAMLAKLSADPASGAKQDAAAAQIGEVQASPTANTVLDRLKSIATALAGTLTVAAHAVTQSGTWTVQPGNTANTTAWKVDGSAFTQPVSGSVTANAGTNLNTSALATSAQVGEVQASPTANTVLDRLKTIATALAGTLTISGTVTANAGTGNHAITAASGSIASGAVASGAVVDGAIVTMGSKTDAAATQTDVTSVSAMSVWKQISKSVQLMVFGAGTAAAAQRTTLASDDPAVAALGAVADAAVTAGATGTISAKLRSISRDIVGGVVLQAGAAVIGAVTQSGSWVLSAGAAIIGKVGIDQTTDGTTNKVAADLRLAGTAVTAGAGAVASGTPRVTLASDDPAVAVLGAKGDAKSAATDTTSISAMSVWKQISSSIQAAAASLAGTLTVATHAVTGSGNFASTVADGANVTLGAKTDAKSTATDTTSVSAMSVWKQVSASIQALAAAAGVAGTPASSVNTVQGIAGMTPVSNRERYISAASTQLVRPANVTAYVANNEISATSPASLSVTVSDTNDDPVSISDILVSSSDTGFGGKNIRVWVYNGATTAGTNQAAFSTAKANFAGTFSGTLRAASDGAVGRLVPDEGSPLITLPASGAKTLQLRVQTLDAATPSANSTTFDFTLHGVQGRAA